jgi:hypothetical protein
MLMNTWLDVHGTAACIAEVGEQLAWAASALQAAQDEHMCLINKPVVKSTKIGHVSKQDSNSATYVFDIGVDNHELDRPSESCWLGLVARPAVVEGFPIQRRPRECSPGLEIQLSAMARLVEARKAQRFDGRTILKGFSNMLIPTKCTEDVVSWHYVQQSDNNRVSYLESQNFPVLDISLGCLENARHILGWCPEVEFYAGKQRYLSYHLSNHIAATKLLPQAARMRTTT